MYSLHQTMLKQLILDVDYGIRKIKNVFNVQRTGFSILKAYVYQFPIYVELMMLLELVLHAIKVTTWLKESAPFPPQTTLNQLISDVKLGIGTIKNVSNVQRTGFSILKAYVYQLVTNVNLMMLLDFVLHALKVTTWLKESAPFPPQTTLNQLISDVKLGIGTIKNVSNVQRTGFSILKAYVYQLVIIVINMILLELVLHVLMDINSLTEIVKFSIHYVNQLITMVDVLLVILDMFFIKTIVHLYQNLPILFFIILNVAHKNLNNLKMKEEYEEVFKFFDFYIYFYYSRLNLHFLFNNFILSYTNINTIL